jgi:hypothetical protein
MNEPWYELGRWSIDTNMSPLLDKALAEFISRIDEGLFRSLSEETLCILDCTTGSSAVRALDISCSRSSKSAFEHHVYILIFRRELEGLSQKAALGEVAREFAGLALRLQHGIDSGSITSGGAMADSVASTWGFQEEIEANVAEREQLGVRDTEKPAKRRRSSIKTPALVQ